MTDDFSDPANWHPIEEHPYLNDPPKVTMPDNLRERIAAALIDALRSQADLGGFLNEYEPCDDDGNPCGGTLLRIDAVVDQSILADAVIAELDLENRMTSAICSYAASEQMALTHHDPNGGGTEFDALTRLISEAPKIARYAMKYRRTDEPA